MDERSTSSGRLRSAWRSGALPVLLCVLVVAGGLILGDVLRRDSVEDFQSTRWNVDLDRSYMEILGYALTGIAAVLLALASRVRPAAPVLWAWGAVLVAVVLDDAVELHEQFGAKLAYHLPLPRLFGLREQDFGELAVWGALGLGCLALLAWTHLRSGKSARRASWVLALLLVLLMVPAVGLDMVHVVLAGDRPIESTLVPLTYLEALGEVGAMAGFLAYALHLLRTPSRADGPERTLATARRGRHTAV